MNTVQGLQTALRLSTSNKLKDRTQGIELVREIFSNRENLNAFGETARKEGGAAWIAFYQCLFQTVVMEKKLVVKPGAASTADKRLADAISLIRWMAERTVHMISKKPFALLFNHMTRLLVFSNQIFPPAALDYAKALRTLLSYPPHLESLDQTSWKILMNICWSAVLGDEVVIDDAWEDGELVEEEEANGWMDIDGFSTQGATSRRTGRSTISQINTELLTLVPILLTSSAAPLIPSLPTKEVILNPVEKPGYTLLLKIHRFFNQYPTETSAHLSVLRALNLLFAELELNCRDDFLSAGVKLLPQLVSLWGTRNKALREQIVIAIRTLLPFVTHKTLVESKHAPGVRDTLEKLMDGLSRETINKWGIEGLDLGVLRLTSLEGGEGPFQLRGVRAGFDFSHEHAMTWAVLELYTDTSLYLYESQSISHPATPTRGGGPSKRRRTENSINALISSARLGNVKNRLLALQVIIFLCDKHLEKLHDEAQMEIRRTMLELLDEDDETLQSWAFIGLSILAIISHEEQHKDDLNSNSLLDSPSSRLAEQKSEEGDWKKVWTHAIRKLSNANTCRAACHAAYTLLQFDKLDSAQSVRDIHSLLRTVDIQGPVFPYDSVCTLLSLTLNIAKSDVRLYSLELENQVLSWLEKCGIAEGPRGISRMEQQTPADVLRLLDAISRFQQFPLCEISIEEVLPDAAIVDRLLEEAKTKPIRDFLLYGTLPANPANNIDLRSPTDETSPAVLSETLTYLEGRARRISTFLSTTLSSLANEWETTKGAAVGPEKARRGIDLIVTALSFQATIQLNGSISDSDCIHSAIRLLSVMQPVLHSNGLNIPAQHLIWRGLEPLVHTKVIKESDWPLLIQPDTQSGIRQDLLPVSQHDSYNAQNPQGQTVTNGEGTESGSGPSQALGLPSQIPASGSYNLPLTPITPSSHSSPSRPAPQRLVNQIWLLPTVSAAFKEVFSLCLQLINNLNSPSANNGNAMPAPGQMDDDDFGEIRNVETDAMPLSKEAMECQRTSASLLNTAIALRLKGYMLVSNLQRPYKDPQLINGLLVAEGSRFLEIGKGLCTAVNSKWLRLGVDAVELIIDALEEMLRSYAYSRDTGLLGLCLEFIKCSMPVWLDVDGIKSDVGERAIHLVCYFASRIDKGTITSWKVKLGMLRFLDEFLHNDLAKDLWLQGMQDLVETDEEAENSDPLAYLTGSLLDVDARIRLRAATSASSVFYRPIVPLDQHAMFYFQVVNKQLGDDKHFDSFVSHTLWKLNCCISTAQQRSAAVFHLYEIPPITSAYNGHLQSGLEAVSRRLGLSSISELYLPYAIVIIRSQLLGNQLAMKIPHRMYGFPTRKAYSQACLQRVGPFMLAEGYLDFYTSACEAAGIAVEDGVDQAFPSAAAIIFAKSFTTVDDAKQSVKDASEKLNGLPGIDTKKGLNKKIEISIDRIAVNLWELLDLQLSTDEIAAILNEMTANNSAGTLYQELMMNDILPIGNAAIDPFAPAQNIIAAYLYLHKQYSSLSTKKMVFNAILRLTSRINDVFLVSEQRRSLRSLSLLAALHPQEFRDPTILQAFLREMLAILPQPDICGITLSMVAWGFSQLDRLQGPIPNLTDLFIQLGFARTALNETSHTGREVGDGLQDWILQSAPVWAEKENIKIAFEAALALWPEPLRRKLSESYSPLYTDLINLSESGTVKNAGELCKQYLQIIKTGTRPEAIDTFVENLFWHLKGKLIEHSDSDMGGINAFLEILYLANGQIRAPPLESMRYFSSYRNSDLTVSSGKQAKDPEATLRASIVQEVARLVDDPSHQTRSIAYKALQGMMSMIQDLVSASMLPPDIVGQISVLTPINIPPMNDEKASLDDKINQSTWIKNSRSADQWSRELVKILCQVTSTDDNFYQSLEPLIESSNVSLRFLLPHLVQASLTCGATSHPEITLHHSKILSDHFAQVVQWPSASLDTTRSIIDTVLHLRHFQPRYRNDELGYNAWLEIDYVVLSEAAVRCGGYATALMFLELARDQEGRGFREDDKRVQKIMYEIYSNVEDPDGFYGIQNHDVRDALLRRLEHEGQSQRAFGWNGALIETASANTFLPALHNLHSFGFNRLASSMTSQTRTEGTEEDPFFLELAWRTGDWDLPMSDTLSKTPQGNLYSALRAVHRERDREAAMRIVNSSVKLEVDRLSGLGMERMAQIKKTTTNLLCLREAAHWLDGDFQSSLDNTANIATVDVKAVGFADIDRSFDFTNAERLTATRLSLLHSGRQRESKNTIGDLLSPKAELLASLEKSCHLRLAEMAKDEDNIQASVNAITAVQQLEIGRTPSDEAQDAFSQVLWAQNEHGLAIQHAQDLLHEAKDRKPSDPGREAILYGRIAHWTDLAKLRAASEIKSTFDIAWKMAHVHKIPNVEQAKIYYEFACFADSHYANLSKSSELERLRSYRDRRLQESTLLSSTSKSSSRRESTSRATTSKAAQEDQEDDRAIKEMESELSSYIKVALRMYGQALGLSDAHDDSITQMVSLWLQHDDNEDLNRDFKGPLGRIPSYKFVFLGPQLAARLYRPTLPHLFNSNLNELLYRMSKEHPYHILYQVITLAHGVPAPSSTGKKTTPAENQGRGPAALEILARLADKKELNTLAQRAAKDMKLFVACSVKWARYDEASQSQSSFENGMAVRKPKAGSQHVLPSNCPLHKLANLPIPIATTSIPIDKSLGYGDVPTIQRYRSGYMIAGGVHRPKIMKVVDTVGKQHQQLFKAEDEVRQDAVMEQVFTMTNDLLTRDRQAKARNLRFRTYNVVPLPERTGIIEFVEGTRGIGEWLKPAHVKYRQGIDISPVDFQAKISKIQDRDPKSPDLVKKYQECMTKFQPVLRHFFVEKHKDPMAWFTMRLNYSRSVAVTSIVGWMVGLGDRHCSNILIDQVSGELVHIDFGIVFEDGRKLRIPEKVPFRLTNDIVDGLGISGIEGTFRRCSEHTLRVLRTSSSLILTVLEVFKNDPLYAWAGDPDKLQRAQGGLAIGELILHDANVKEKADRVLSKIKNKLGKGLSVEYTVNMLIQEARDVEHLARIYHGWAAWF